MLWSESLGRLVEREDYAKIVDGEKKFHQAAVIGITLPWINDTLSALGLMPLLRQLLKRLKGISFMIEVYGRSSQPPICLLY